MAYTQEQFDEDRRNTDLWLAGLSLEAEQTSHHVTPTFNRVAELATASALFATKRDWRREEYKNLNGDDHPQAS